MRKILANVLVVLSTGLLLGESQAFSNDDWASYCPAGTRYIGSGLVCNNNEETEERSCQRQVFCMNNSGQIFGSAGGSYGRGSYGGGGGGGNGSASTESPESQDKDSDPNQCKKSNPILVGTGNKFQTEADFFGKGEHPLTVIRNYNNFSNYSGVFGKKWIGSFESKLTFNGYPYHSIDKHGSRGEIIRYSTDPRNPSGVYFARGNDIVNTITQQSDGTYKLNAGNGFTETYNSNGKILEKKFPGGIKHTYSYTNGNLSRITHTSGRYLAFSWNSGRVKSITDNAGNTYTYSYSGVYLSSASKPGSPPITKSYLYEDSRFPGALTQININGSKYATFSYNSSGKGQSSSHWASDNVAVEKSEFTYGMDIGGRDWTKITNPLGHEERYKFEEVNGVNKLIKVDRLYSPDCPAASRDIGYDEKGMTSYTTDWTGVRTEYKYNDNGQLTEQTYAKDTAEEKTTYYTWNNGESYITKIETSDLITEFEYDALSRVTKTTRTNLSQYGVSGEARVTNSTYSSHSNGITATLVIDGPRTDVNDVTTYNYDNKGNLTSIENAEGHRVSYSNYDVLGNVGTITSASGLKVNLAYDAQGRILSKEVEHPKGDMITSYEYNALGKLKKVTYPDGNYITNTYDQAYRLVRTTDRNGAYISYNYNANGNVTRKSIITSSTSYNPPPPSCGPIAQNFADTSLIKAFMYDECLPTPTTTYVTHKESTFDYDVMGRVKAAYGANGQKLTYSYDDNSNVTSLTYENGDSVSYEYDNLNRVKKSFDELNKATSYTYDVAGRIKTVTDARGLVTSYAYSGFGELEKLISPDTGVTTYDYNKVGQVTRVVKSNGDVTTMSYDALGRVTKQSTHDETKSFYYDNGSYGKGKLTKFVDGSGQTTFIYDKVGNLIQKKSNIGSESYTLNYDYDGMNRLISMTYPSGHKILYTYDDLGQVSKVEYKNGSTVKVVAENISYRPFGPMSGFTYGNSVTRSLAHDKDYRLTKIRTQGDSSFIQHLQYLYNTNNNITEIINNSATNNSQAFDYDKVGRLTGVTSDSGDHSYKYDSVGNRTEQTVGNVTKTFEYSQVSNQLEAVRQGSLQGEVLEYFNYNQNGHTEYYSENELVYNGSDRLVEYKGVDPQKPFTWVLIDTGGVLAPIKAPLYQDITTYKYNAQGQRVQKSNNSETYHYLYDEGGKLIAEQKTDGSALKEYIYLYGEVIGFVKGSELYFVHNDHLTRAEAITDKDQNVVWRANNYAFDRSVSVNQIGDYNLGFPGQYYDEETGLYYNYFRDYDPSTGRYIQSDPLGLAAGVNTYGYVGGNPVSKIDPLGLAESCSCRHSGRNALSDDRIANLDRVTGLDGDREVFPISQDRANRFNNSSDPTTGRVIGWGGLTASIGGVAFSSTPVIGWIGVGLSGLGLAMSYSGPAYEVTSGHSYAELHMSHHGHGYTKRYEYGPNGEQLGVEILSDSDNCR